MTFFRQSIAACTRIPAGARRIHAATRQPFPLPAPSRTVAWLTSKAASLAASAALALGVMGASAPAAAQAAASPAAAYPSGVVRIVVAFPAGGTTDILARLLAEKLTPRLGQQVIVENRPSASGINGSDGVAKSAPDGLTLMMAPSLHATNPFLFSKLPYDTLRDFAPVVLVATTPYVLAMHPSVPAKSVRELVAYLKQNPGKLNISISAVGSPQHLAAELFRRMTGAEVVQIPYKGSGAIITDLIAGRVSLAFENQAVVSQFIKAGQIKALVVTGATRSGVFPEVPTMVESGYEFRLDGWFGLVAPAKTPPEIVQRINREVAAVLREPDVRERLAVLGATPMGGPPEELRDYLAREMDVWGRVIREANIRLD